MTHDNSTMRELETQRMEASAPKKEPDKCSKKRTIMISGKTPTSQAENRSTTEFNLTQPHGGLPDDLHNNRSTWRPDSNLEPLKNTKVMQTHMRTNRNGVTRRGDY